MSSTELRVVFRVRGVNFDPDWITQRTGVAPSRAYHVGEARGRSAELAGWEWQSATGPDDEPLIATLVAELGPHADVFRACRDAGADVRVTVVGEVRGDVIQTVEQAEARRFMVWPDEEFQPIFDVDRVGVSLSEEAIRFLAAVGASYATHIDCEYQAFSGGGADPRSTA